MLAALVSAFVLGALFSALVVVSIWLYTAPLVSRKRKDHMTPYTFPSLPEAGHVPLDAALYVVVCCRRL